MTPDLPDRICLARTFAKLSQTQLAAACGWTWGSRIGNYEQGKNEPSLSDLDTIADATGVSCVWLRTGTGKMSAVGVGESKAQYLALTHEEVELVESFRRANVRERPTIQSVVKMLTTQAPPDELDTRTG